MKRPRRQIFRGPGKPRAWARFALAVAYFYVACALARQAAYGFDLGTIFPLVRMLFVLFLIVIGFGYMGLSYDGQRQPLRAMGLARRPGWGRELATGAALGWGMMTAIALVMALTGTMYVHFWWSPRAFFLLAIQIATLAVGAVVGEIAFRGYPFQKLMEATGPFTATVLSCCFFGLMRMESPDAGTAGIWVSGIGALLLSLAYLRTRALWLPVGIHFAWATSMGALFGLPVAGRMESAVVVQTAAYGQHWLTGGDYGPEGSWLAFFVLAAGVFVLVRVTRDIAWKMNQPDLQPAGIPVDIPHSAPASPAASASVAEQPKAPQLVSIDFSAPSASAPLPPPLPPGSKNSSLGS